MNSFGKTGEHVFMASPLTYYNSAMKRSMALVKYHIALSGASYSKKSNLQLKTGFPKTDHKYCSAELKIRSDLRHLSASRFLSMHGCPDT